MLARRAALHSSTGFSFARCRLGVTPPRICKKSPTSHITMATAAVEAPVDLKKAYDEVCEKLKDLSALNGISGIIGWDEMVMMPSGAAGSRGAQKAALAGVIYDKKADPELGKLLGALKEAVAKGDNGLDEIARANIRDAHKDYVRTTAIPKKLAQRMARLESEAYTAWVEARKASDFSKFAPFLEQWVECNREKAKYIDPNGKPYDVLLEDYEKGMTSARLDEVFTQVRDGLIPLIAKIKAKGANTISEACVKGNFDTEKQAALCRQVALDIGFSLDTGRLDVSVHPFTGGGHPTDVRMTTRFKSEDISEGLTGAIHETGHALYEQGRNLDYDGLPVGNSLSMGVHESQSLLWERMVGLSRPFATYLLTRLKESFPTEFNNVTEEQLYEAFNVVKDPSYIRVESDEVTYPMHVILRYEIEKGLMEGSVKVEDVPKLWNAKMKEYLGSEPTTDAQGCLQDVHWSAGLFGYFPTYSLGAMYATQIYQCALKHIPDLESQIAKGEFSTLKSWLNEKIHKVGSLPASGDELMQQVTGSKLDPAVFLAYLNKKYGELYKL